ncbi:MAG: radical SAM protein [Aquificaceae bacterium]|nr:radical SAM protein [Aquificaceae bacterium]MDW8096644.1 radical SAM protein [Aquificaceae bacterium]
MKLLQELRSSLNRLFVFELSDHSRVEAVFYRGDTLCLSTQVGCALGCPFCISGADGLRRNLSAEEILGQYELLRSALPVRRIAFAGIGEPLMNWEQVETAFWHFKKSGLGVSFYTTGYPTSKLRRLLQLPHRGVTISLHAVSEKKRKALLPHAGRLQDLLQALRETLKELPKRKRKRISLAYLLLKGVNDGEQDLRAFGELVRELGLSATLLRYNPTVKTYQDVEEEEYEKAFLLLRSYGIRVTLSTRFRKDSLGGCGTLTIRRV